jgi:VWFA-related protein
MKRLIVFVVAFVLSALSLAAQAQPQQGTSGQASAPTIRATAPEVMLDMVFRDKKGKAIRDIRPEEIHVSDDGVDQNLNSFHLIEGTAPANPAAVSGNQPTALEPMREIRLVSLVFENLDQEGKRFFRQALKDMLDMAPEPNLYFSVLVVDQKLHCIQPFTADRAALLKSVDKSAMWSFTQYMNQSAEVKAELKQVLASGESQIQGNGTGAPSQAQIQGAVNYQMAKMQYDMLEVADASDRRYQSRVTVDALMALVRAQAELPGRKVVLYFNPWLNISETVKEEYSNVISTANRANVSFYTVDPKGLVTWSQNSMGRDMLNGAAGEIRGSETFGANREVSIGQARAAENAEDSLRANPLRWLRDLAQQTGGATIAETNDYRAPLRTAMEEVRTYYEAAYMPHIELYDGKFRKISVRVDRPGVVVHTRSGYFALPQLQGGQQLYTYELPLLNSLTANTASPPKDVAFEVAAERFNARGPKIEYMLTLEAPLKGLTFTPQPDQKTSSVDAALLLVLRNPNGEIVQKFSKDFAVQVALDKVDAYKAGNLLQTFHTELPSGTYTLEAAVMDRNSDKIGVKKSSLIIPQPSAKLSMSEVVLVRRTDAVQDTQMMDAFYFPGGKIVPTLTTTLKGGSGNILSFYFTVYPDHPTKDPLQLRMAFYKEGQYLGASQATLPQAQPDGRIPYIANLSADKLTPGAYEIRMGVTQDSSNVEEKVAFQIE